MQRWREFLQIDEARNALPEGCIEIGDSIFSRWNSFSDGFPSNNLTINHSDFKADNIFFDWSDREDPVIIFDWASFMIGRGVSDLARLLASSIEAELRRQIELDIVKYYHERITDSCLDRYSFEECLADYRRSLLMYSYFPILAFSLNDTSNEKARIHGRQVVNRWFSAIIENEAMEFLP